MKRAAYCLTGLLLACGCSSDPNSSADNGISIRGNSTTTDAAVEGQALIIVDDKNHVLGEHCPVETQHRASFKTTTDSNGTFTLKLASSDFTPISHPECAFSSDPALEVRVVRLSLNYPGKNLRGTARADGATLSRSGAEGWNTLVEVTVNPVPAESAGGSPDLQMNAFASSSSWSIEEKNFEANSCALEEGCIAGSGTRKLLSFDTSMVNVGDAPIVVGAPTSHPDGHYDSCHGHVHLGNMMLYELVSSTNSVVAVGRKQGFCLMDSERASGNVEGVYDCDNQGISAGWEDVYDRSLDCQWIDVTDVAPGDYLLRLTANPDFILDESNFGNNQVEVPVTIPSNALRSVRAQPQARSAW